MLPWFPKKIRVAIRNENTLAGGVTARYHQTQSFFNKKTTSLGVEVDQRHCCKEERIISRREHRGAYAELATALDVSHSPISLSTVARLRAEF